MDCVHIHGHIIDGLCTSIMGSEERVMRILIMLLIMLGACGVDVDDTSQTSAPWAPDPCGDPPKPPDILPLAYENPWPGDGSPVVLIHEQSYDDMVLYVHDIRAWRTCHGWR